MFLVFTLGNHIGTRASGLTDGGMRDESRPGKLNVEDGLHWFIFWV